MPILYVHGVANRIDPAGNLDGWIEIEAFLRRYIAPEISAQPEAVTISYAYWGDLGVKFYWNGESRPRSQLLGMGAATTTASTAEKADILDSLDSLPPKQPTAPAPPSGLIAAGPSTSLRQSRLRDLTNDERADFLVGIARARNRPPSDLIQVDELARDPAFVAKLNAATTAAEEMQVLRQAASKLEQTGLLAQGSSWWNDVTDRVGELFDRVDSSAANALTKLVMEARGSVNDLATLFVGDVFAYLQQKDHRPGTIRGAVIEAIRAAKNSAPKDEPLIVVTHSMGGQIIYDIVTSFLEAENLRIDFWVATASQVGLFEEMKAFIKSDVSISSPARVPTPPAKVLGWWWNVWDPNDIISYTAKPIFDKVLDDEAYEGGAALAQAHGTYLKRPSFYRKMAEKIRTAKAQNYNRI